MNRPTKSVVILGGGAAGWITAGLLAAKHSTGKGGLSVTLIESPDIPTVGVGEGTWPSMRETLRTIGICEKDLFAECEASFKQGSKFIGWSNGSAEDSYHHPFVLPMGYLETNLVPFWNTVREQHSFADTYTNQAKLIDLQKAPKQFSTPDYAGVSNYGYHFDAAKFSAILARHCINTLKVNHIADTAIEIMSHDCGDIKAILTKNHGEISGDLFIDCSGQSAVLIGQHYDVPIENKQQVILNNTAIAAHVPVEATSEIASATYSTAQSAGWIWDIGLPSRRGVGYVYASDYISHECAEQELRTYIAKISNSEMSKSVKIRKISITPGYRATPWYKNCVAVGMSSGFIEPLEASALAMVELSAKLISDTLPANRAAMDIINKRFNEKFVYRWQRVIEFLKLHYVLSKRTDSKYWLAHRSKESIPERLSELLTLWKTQPPSRHDFDRIEEIFPSASYQYIYYGMGGMTENSLVKKSVDEIAFGDRCNKKSRQQFEQYFNGLTGNRTLLNKLVGK